VHFPHHNISLPLGCAAHHSPRSERHRREHARRSEI
jgi:hypothetical protein